LLVFAIIIVFFPPTDRWMLPAY